MDVTENDLTEMNMKRGHRRLLQRHIATCKGIPASQPLFQLHRQYEDFGENTGGCPPRSPISPCSPPGQRLLFAEMLHAIASSTEEEDDYANTAQSGSSVNAEDQNSSSGKRQYRRHPKADLNAPIKPASGYVMFANALREDIKDKKLSFADIAKVVGERWKQISAVEKFYWEDTAAKAKQDYLKQAAEYKKTDCYESFGTFAPLNRTCVLQRYQQYLKQFEQQGSDRVLGRPRRRRGLGGSQRGESPTMNNIGTSSGNESFVSQREPSAAPAEARSWESLTRTSSGDSVSQPYRTLSVVHRQSSIRNNEKRPEVNRANSQQSSTSNESTASSESNGAVPSLEREANRY
ncbi:hypothetical protein Unana1_07725 [Umbelopsis nana]